MSTTTATVGPVTTTLVAEPGKYVSFDGGEDEDEDEDADHDSDHDRVSDD